MFFSLWCGDLMIVASLLVACAGIWSLLRNSSLPSNWMIFFTLWWDVWGKVWSNRSDTSMKFLTLLLHCSGIVPYWFVLWYEPSSLAVSCGTECILGSILSGFGYVSKLGGFCATFLGNMGRVWCICKSWFGVNSKFYSLSDYLPGGETMVGGRGRGSTSVCKMMSVGNLGLRPNLRTEIIWWNPCATVFCAFISLKGLINMVFPRCFVFLWESSKHF